MGSESTSAVVSFEGEYDGTIVGSCDQFPTGFVDVDGTLSFAVFEESAMSGSADLTVPYSDNTVPMTGTIDEQGTVDATLQISGSNACNLIGGAPSDGELSGSFTCPQHECDGLWSASRTSM